LGCKQSIGTSCWRGPAANSGFWSSSVCIWQNSFFGNKCVMFILQAGSKTGKLNQSARN
uniref:Uncharacterized protein n=1 Tax=Phasianus colchicus TaxID=9054 RepID=A0A669PV77_PHACC